MICGRKLRRTLLPMRGNLTLPPSAATRPLSGPTTVGCRTSLRTLIRCRTDKSNYNYDDLLKPVMSTLSYQGHPYAVPFYGESSFLMYNKQIFAQHHLTM